MKRRLAALALGICITALPVRGENLPTLRINGKESSGVSHVEDGTTYVSLRTVGETVYPEAEIVWENGAAIIRNDDVTLTAIPGEQWILSNGRYLYVPGKVQNREGRVLVPIRVLAEGLGALVEWNGEERSIAVISREQPKTETYGEDEIYWLSRIISAESRGEPLEGQIAVGNVVLNRVKSNEFPDTIYGVIFDGRWGGQFEPVRNGTIYETPTLQSVIAAKLCLEGADAVGESLYFLNPEKAQNFWTVKNRTYMTTIGCHDFYV